MGDVSSIETANSGFVINYKSRKMALHVRNSEELHAWTIALVGGIAPAPNGALSPGVGNLTRNAPQRAQSAPPPKVAKLDPDLSARVRKQLQAMIPQGGDAFSIFAQAKTDLISSTELTKMIFKKAGSKAKALSPADINEFIFALGEVGQTDQIKIKRLVQFIESGDLSKRSGPAPVVPRVALVAKERGAMKRASLSAQGQVTRTSDPLANKNPVFKLETHDSRSKDGGFCWKPGVNWKPHDLAEKLTTLEPFDHNKKAVARSCSPKSQIDPDLPDKIGSGWTGEARVLQTRGNPGSLNWTKINHCSQGDYADPEKSSKNASKGHDGTQTSKITEEFKGPPIPPIATNTAFSDKVTDPGRRPLASTRMAAKSTDCILEKVTEPGRVNAGWALPYDKSRFHGDTNKYYGISHSLGITPRGPETGFAM
jgi:hypothetical protein